ncbi:hypothetical protein AB7M56_007228 [Bradyrhizobium elkanii]|nr:hypothetical protein [Bradyrhizobium elkanii]MCS3520404.1 hypothetical protein [Bradyrhizobium elkanii]MCS4068059.1 hypothetical protein [Bradyrhizobium elkanii]MCS4083595.1 hypothetical protein [Bradyrhizobium elkanii]MCS4105200.1 hypothetical protein [Bradyrhizobium elkanii]
MTVVPAKAGTHTPRPQLLRKLVAALLPTNVGG